MRILLRALLLLACSAPTSSTFAQQLTDMGMMATGVLSRTRAGGADFQQGDMMYLTALHPADSGSMYVSAHMEYLDDTDNWQAVPTAGTALGKEYQSGRYPGVRDYVKFENTNANTTRHICLFMPYGAASLPTNKFYQRRYVLRLWDRNNEPVSRTALPAEAVQTKKDNGGKFVIVTVKAKTCASLVDANNEPIPESQDEGTLRFFSTRTGKYVCPGGAE